jgi:hypothetical protein
MLGRCRNPKHPAYSNYGGRGISVCKRWLDFSSFYADMGPRPLGKELERINNEGNYEQGNCCWETKKQQAINRRTTRFISFEGREISVTDLALLLGIKRSTLNMRIRRGWKLERLNQETRRYDRV